MINCNSCGKFAWVCVKCGNINDSYMVHGILNWFGFMKCTIDHIGKRYEYDNELEYYRYIMEYK